MPKIKKEEFKGLIALIALAAISVLLGAVSRHSSIEFSSVQQIYLRGIVALILGSIIFKKYIHPKKLLKISINEWVLLIARTSATFLVGAILWVDGFSQAKLSNASFIDAIPMSAILGFLLLGEKITAPKIIFTLLTFLGVILVAVQNLNNLFSWGHGELLVLLSVIFFAWRNISRRWHTKLLNDQEITLLMLFIGVILLIIYSLIIREGVPVAVFSLYWFGIILIGGFFSVLILFFTNYGFAKVEAVLAGNISALEIVFGLIFSVLLFREYPTIREITGGLLVATSIIGLSKTKKL